MLWRSHSQWTSTTTYATAGHQGETQMNGTPLAHLAPRSERPQQDAARVPGTAPAIAPPLGPPSTFPSDCCHFHTDQHRFLPFPSAATHRSGHDLRAPPQPVANSARAAATNALPNLELTQTLGPHVRNGPPSADQLWLDCHERMPYQKLHRGRAGSPCWHNALLLRVVQTFAADASNDSSAVRPRAHSPSRRARRVTGHTWRRPL